MESLILDELVPIVTSTSHDRISVGVAIGIALMFMQTGSQGESILQMLRTHSNAYLRMSGALGTGLAHAAHHTHHAAVATSESGEGSMCSLLEMIASDVSDNVRRNAVIALGFIFIDRPSAFLSTAQLLLQSYNPHIRYAAALIAGLINAGTANAQLSDLLLKTMDDSEDFVAQGAAIGLGALLMETNAKNTPQVG